jgi:hypothetical protein
MPGRLTHDHVNECYQRAAEARRIADAPGIRPAERADLLEVERRWLSLARSYTVGSRLRISSATGRLFRPKLRR